MPYLSIQANISVGTEEQQALLRRGSEVVAQLLGKPERYVMVALRQDCPMLFGGSDEPAAYLDLRSIELPEDLTPALSRRLCELVSAELAIPQNRIFIGFSDVARSRWGWNGTTF